MLETELLPASEPGSKRLLVVMHGLGDSMDGYRWLPEMLRLPWLHYLLVNAPDPYFGGFSWYDYSGNPRPGILRSRKLMFACLDRQRELGFASNHTVLSGFSQGCLMTLDVGLRYPELFAGLVGISGYAFEPEELIKELSPVARQQRLLLTHGTEDTLIPISLVRPQINLLQRAGLSIQWKEFAKGHTIAGEEELAVIRQFIRGCFEKPPAATQI